jgi:hypothetical protein
MARRAAISSDSKAAKATVAFLVTVPPRRKREDTQGFSDVCSQVIRARQNELLPAAATTVSPAGVRPVIGRGRRTVGERWRS